MKTTVTTGGFFGHGAARSAARFAVVLGLAGTVFATLAPAAPVLADPPSWGDRNRDDHKDDKREQRQDKRDIQQDVRRLRQDKNDLRQDRRDDRRDDNRNDNWRDDHRNDNRNGGWQNNNRNSGWDNNRSDRFDQIRQQDANRQKNKNDWRNLTILGGAATVYGLLNHDPTVTFIGAAGTLYSASRYESDRRSQSQNNRARAELFDRGSFERDGVRYTKRDKWQNGEHYYYFAR